jgi:hypothetical protein
MESADIVTGILRVVLIRLAFGVATVNCFFGLLLNAEGLERYELLCLALYCKSASI